MSAATDSCSGVVAGVLAMVVGIVAIAVAGGAYGNSTDAKNQIATLNQTVIILQQELAQVELAVSRLPMMSGNTTRYLLATGQCSLACVYPDPNGKPFSLYQTTYHDLSAIYLVLEQAISNNQAPVQLCCQIDPIYTLSLFTLGAASRGIIFTPEQLQSISCTNPNSIPEYYDWNGAPNYYSDVSPDNGVIFSSTFSPFANGVDTWTFAANTTFPITYTYTSPPPGSRKRLIKARKTVKMIRK